jgi:hypothetical protein
MAKARAVAKQIAFGDDNKKCGEQRLQQRQPQIRLTLIS